MEEALEAALSSVFQSMDLRLLTLLRTLSRYEAVFKLGTTRNMGLAARDQTRGLDKINQAHGKPRVLSQV